MRNVKIERNGEQLVITVDLAKNLGPSKSGKTDIVATTEGNVKLDDRTHIGLNVYRSRA